MDEKIGLVVLFYGGFIAAFIFLVLASIMRRFLATARVLCVFAFLGLIYEGGCVVIAAGIGRATGGGGDSVDDFIGIFAVAFLITCIWCFLLGGRPTEAKGQFSDSMTQMRSANDETSSRNGSFVSLLVLSGMVLLLLPAWPSVQHKIPLRGWFLISEFGLIVALYAVSCGFLFRNRILAFTGLLIASFAAIVCLRFLGEEAFG